MINRTTYEDTLQQLLNDPGRFKMCSAGQTDDVKKKINKIATEQKSINPELYKMIRRIGTFNPGHLYGLPKIHKNQENPPLRPIISMSGTVTHDISQYLNDTIRPYINSENMVNSSNELLLRLSNMKIEENQQLLSLDVESLFINVPVHTTIDIIIDRAYNHPTILPPNIPANILRDLLTICTTETPFLFNSNHYIQCDGVSMGSPLGPTFADFYMSHIESNLLSQDMISNPVFYVRYVDDILAIFNSKHHVHHFVNRFQRNSVLKFTTEFSKNNSFHFLDVSMTLNPSGYITTGVYTKPTDQGLHTNFDSHIPLPYKKSIAKTLIHRAIIFSSTWELCHSELDMLKRILISNNFPLHLLDQLICSDLH